MEGIFETVTVTVRVTVHLKHIEISGEDSIVVLSCKKFRYGKWKILKMSPEADQNPSNEEREIERQRRKVIHEKNYTRMTSRCKRIGMIRYSFLKQEGNNSIEKLIKNLFDHVHRKSLYKNYKNIREIFTVINCRKMKWKFEKLWSKNFFATKSYKFYKNGTSVRISIGKGLNHITEWKLQFRKYIIFLVKEYNKKYHLRYY